MVSAAADRKLPSAPLRERLALRWDLAWVHWTERQLPGCQVEGVYVGKWALRQWVALISCESEHAEHAVVAYDHSYARALAALRRELRRLRREPALAAAWSRAQAATLPDHIFLGVTRSSDGWWEAVATREGRAGAADHSASGYGRSVGEALLSYAEINEANRTTVKHLTGR